MNQYNSTSAQYPLYEKDTHQVDFKCGNDGLRFTKFFNAYQLSKYPDIKPVEESKTKFLHKFCHNSSNRQLSQQLEQFAIKQLGLAKSVAGAGDGMVFKSEGHFVTGMGIEHPVENGFLWHHTLGVPYLSGSQVKGIVRAAIERYWDDANSESKADTLHKWFGSEDKNPQKVQRDNQAGELIFFDAIPVEMPKLTVDIMTPHYGKWYAEGATATAQPKNKDDYDKIPGDWHSPIPVPFLSVSEIKLLFTLGKRPNSDIDIAEVFQVLSYALEYMGAGAKTQTGLGFFELDEDKTTDFIERFKARKQEASKQAENENQLKQASSELERELLQTIQNNGWEEQTDSAKTHFTNNISAWLDTLEQLEQTADERACIEHLERVARIHYPVQMKSPDGKKTKETQRKWINRLLKLHQS